MTDHTSCDVWEVAPAHLIFSMAAEFVVVDGIFGICISS